ncbi:MAG: (deoxy)nucleoside triphosphate pyrophosphohydrolase [Clostridia bacterium]|nr:(deoxy)nucleoside triphosphate pyrophosphohydrolase [Clostridia bacterium]
MATGEIRVVAGVICRGNTVLCMQRGKGKAEETSFRFEFPGGKIEDGETAPEALRRELREELNLNVRVTEQDRFMTVTHSYEAFTIHMDCFWVQYPEDGNATFCYREHVSHRWMERDRIQELAWAPADVAVMEKVRETSEKA